MPRRPPRPSELRKAFRHQLHPARRTAVIAWASFATTFTGVRVLTHSIKDGKGPFNNVSPGGLHLHHYLWGIATVSGVAGYSIRGEDPRRSHPALGVLYGVGMALIVDEFALLLDLKDVYWAKQGRWSVDLAVGIIGVAGVALEGGPAWRELSKAAKRDDDQDA